MPKNYIGSDEHWIDSVNQRYDENERYYKNQVDNRTQPDDRVQCYKTMLECENYEHYNTMGSCAGCGFPN